MEWRDGPKIDDKYRFGGGFLKFSNDNSRLWLTFLATFCKCTRINISHHLKRKLLQTQLAAGNSAFVCRDGLRRLAAWHVPGGAVGPPAWWTFTPNVEVGQTT